MAVANSWDDGALYSSETPRMLGAILDSLTEHSP